MFKSFLPPSIERMLAFQNQPHMRVIFNNPAAKLVNELRSRNPTFYQINQSLSYSHALTRYLKDNHSSFSQVNEWLAKSRVANPTFDFLNTPYSKYSRLLIGEVSSLAGSRIAAQLRVHDFLTLKDSLTQIDMGRTQALATLQNYVAGQQTIEVFTKHFLDNGIHKFTNLAAHSTIQKLDIAFVATTLSEYITDIREYDEAFDLPLSSDEVLEQNLVFTLALPEFDLGSILAELAETIHKTIKSPTVGSYAGVIGLFISIYSLFISSDNQAPAIEKHIEQMDKLAEQVEPLIERLQEQETKSSFFVAKIEVDLRLQASDTAGLIMILPQHSQLVALETRGEWMNVEFIDYLNEDTFTGWIKSENLLPVITSKND